MALFNRFKQGFNCIGDIKILILVAKKNILKATEAVKCFLCTFYLEPRFTSHQFHAATLLKKIFDGVWDGNFEQSEQVKLEQLPHLVPTMVVPTGSLNSWNQWINDWPLYQSLFQSQIISKTMSLAKHFIKQVCGWVLKLLKLLKLLLWCFSFDFQRAIS